MSENLIRLNYNSYGEKTMTIINVPHGTLTSNNQCPEPIHKICPHYNEEFITFYNADCCPDCIDVIEDEDDPECE